MTTVSGVSGAFFVREGDRYIPTGIGRSPWNPDMQGGAPIAGLVGQLLGHLPASGAMVPQRLTIDILGAVPMAPLTPSIRLLRDGRRVQLAELVLESEGRTYVRATMLRTRLDGGEETGPTPTRPFPEGREPLRRVMSEAIRIEGDDTSPGPGALWMRVVTPIVEGEALEPLACIATAADWGTTVAPPASPRDWTYANLDISIHLLRMPRTDWLLLDGWSELGGNGCGLAHMRIGDRLGMIGMTHQSIFLEPRR